MKLNIGLAAALAGCAAAAQNAADVFILRDSADASSSSSSTTPSITPSIARLLLLQRLAPAGKGPSVSDIPEDADLAEVVSVMNQFGPAPVSLFEKAVASPSQLLIMLEGLTEDQISQTAQTLKLEPALRISDPPSASAHDQLIANDFYNVGVTKEHECPVSQVTNPFEERCWSGQSTVAKYNVQKVSPVSRRPDVPVFTPCSMLTMNTEPRSPLRARASRPQPHQAGRVRRDGDDRHPLPRCR